MNQTKKSSITYANFEYKTTTFLGRSLWLSKTTLMLNHYPNAYTK